MLRMAQAESPEAAKMEGIRIAQEMLAEARTMVQGVQVSAPSGRFEAALTVMESVLAGRSAAGRAEAEERASALETGAGMEQGVNLGKL